MNCSICLWTDLSSNVLPALCITVTVIKSKAQDLVDAMARRIIDEIRPPRVVIGLSGGADSTLALLICRRVRDLCTGSALYSRFGC